MATELFDRPLTWDDLVRYWALDDRLRYEVIDGQLVTTPTPWVAHQAAIGKLMMAMSDAVRDDPRATVLTFVAVKLSPHNIVVPDLLYYPGSRRDIGGEEAIEGVPDLIVEVMDDSTRERDLNRKARIYAASGVREYWQVDPDARSMAINLLGDGSYRAIRQEGEVVRSVVLDGLTIRVSVLFADLQ